MRRLTIQRPWAKTINLAVACKYTLPSIGASVTTSYRPSVTILHVTTAPGTNLRRQVRVV